MHKLGFSETLNNNIEMYQWLTSIVFKIHVITEIGVYVYWLADNEWQYKRNKEKKRHGKNQPAR